MKKTILLITALITILFCNAQSYNFDKGVKAYNEGEFEKAIDYFSREINDNPKSALSLYYRAAIYNYQDQNSYALKDINNSIKFFILRLPIKRIFVSVVYNSVALILLII